MVLSVTMLSFTGHRVSNWCHRSKPWRSSDSTSISSDSRVACSSTTRTVTLTHFEEYTRTSRGQWGSFWNWSTTSCFRGCMFCVWRQRTLLLLNSNRPKMHVCCQNLELYTSHIHLWLLNTNLHFSKTSFFVFSIIYLFVKRDSFHSSTFIKCKLNKMAHFH